MSQAFRYWAFISYSRHDARVAGLLVDALARMPVPRAHRDTVGGGPTCFSPVFLDTRDAAAAPELDGELRRALRESARLIVLCSPFAVQSGYVAEEIRYFQSLERGADILCLIASGIPDATDQGQPALECFPAPLRQPPTAPGQAAPRPLAAALGQEGPAEWRAALEQLAAGLTGQSLGAWRDGVSQRQTRRRLGLVAAVLGPVGLASGAAWAWWLPQQVHAKQVVRRWGALQPVDGVSAAVAAQRPVTYRFERRGAFGPWTLVRAVNGHGDCPSDGEPIQSLVGEPFKLSCTRSRACAVRMNFTGDRIAAEQVLDQHGQVLETVSYSDPTRAVLTEAVVGCSRREGNIEFVQIERHDSGPWAGLDRVLRFGGGEDKSPRPTSDYAFGWQLAYDNAGRVIERQVLGADGRPRMGRQGWAAQRLTYNAAGDVVAEATLGLDGQPVDARGGFATRRREVDALGRETVVSSFDATGQPVHDEHGRWGNRSAYDDQGRPVDLANIGAEGQRVNDGHGVARRQLSYAGPPGSQRVTYTDAAGQPVPEGDFGCVGFSRLEPRGKDWLERRCFDAQGQPAYTRQGWHLARSTYGPRGEELSEAFFDTADKPTLCTEKDLSCPHHRSESHFDERGNAVSDRMFGVDGSPAVTASGVSRIDSLYDSRNRISRLVNYGPDGQPARNAEQTVAIANRYDDFGRTVERRRVGPDGQPLLLGLKVYARRSQFDDLGNEVLEETLDVNGRRVADDLGEGYAAVRRRFDARGQLIELRFFGQSDEPAVDRQGWYGYRLVRDRWGRDTAATRLGPDGQPQAAPSGELERRFELDIRGHVQRMSLHGADGRLVAQRDGVAQWVYTLDLAGHRTRERRQGVAGQLVADAQGVAGNDWQLDARGRVIEQISIGADDQPIASQGSGIARIRLELDGLGRELRKRFYDAQDQPHANSDGSYGLAFEYNARGQVVEQQGLGADGRPADDRHGVAVARTEYEVTGGQREQRFYAADGQPTARAQAAIVRRVNDASGRDLETSFYDAQGKPMASPSSGRWRQVLTRDVWGRVLTEQSLDGQGQPVNRRDEGWSRREFSYGTWGALEVVRCLDTQGRAVKPCRQEE